MKQTTCGITTQTRMISLIPESHHCTKRQSTMTRRDHQIRQGTMTTQLENQEILIGEVIRRGDWRPNDQILHYYGHPLEQHPSSSQEEKKEEGPSGREQAEQPPPNRPPHSNDSDSTRTGRRRSRIKRNVAEGDMSGEHIS